MWLATRLAITYPLLPEHHNPVVSSGGESVAVWRETHHIDRLRSRVHTVAVSQMDGSPSHAVQLTTAHCHPPTFRRGNAQTHPATCALRLLPMHPTTPGIRRPAVRACGGHTFV